jgi:predicted ABC-type ATPase
MPDAKLALIEGLPGSGKSTIRMTIGIVRTSRLMW